MDVGGSRLIMGDAMFLEIQAREEYAYLLAIGEETKYPDTGKISVKIVNEQIKLK